MDTDEKNGHMHNGKNKTSFKERLRQLIGDRSLRSAAKAWGLPYSTLNNYLEKDTTPSLYIALNISKIENVSLEWLAAGERGEENQAPYHREKATNDDTKMAWQLMFDMLEPEEVNALLRLIHRKGVEHILKCHCDSE
ncbi:hypothetical protein [Citrobacter sp. JGM124]|uniref:hypothetical protein n=1 Tax=Citrobacter sp. JGM124 TaxID=2799789 RepID=UPI001BA58500|nr:hypothetical protein [Citrobacter sp. JGM124]MBS0849671.1 hypothetical protein [Citrobacter sp. JGM124]